MDGIDLRNVSMESLRNQIAVVLQDTFLFKQLFEIILLMVTAAGNKKIIQAGKAAYAHEFIQELPGVMIQKLADAGVAKRGPKQRLALAKPS